MLRVNGNNSAATQWLKTVLCPVFHKNKLFFKALISQNTVILCAGRRRTCFHTANQILHKDRRQKTTAHISVTAKVPLPSDLQT